MLRIAPPALPAGAALRLLVLVLSAALAAACGPDEPEPPPRIPDAEVPALLEDLTHGDTPAVRSAAERITEARDRRFVPVLIELLRASQLGFAARRGYEARVVALERLTGEAFGADWLAWARWQAQRDQPAGRAGLPPGFIAWKGDLFTALDPLYGRVLREDVPVRGHPERIDWGGTSPESLPPLDDPAVLPLAEAEYLEAGEPVAGLMVDGKARAYPLRILDWHEVVNDRLGGRAVAVTRCALCGSVAAYAGAAPSPPPQDRRLFAPSGLLYQGSTLLLDRATRTLWVQLTGRPLLGPLAEDPERALPRLPLVLTSAERWGREHPDSTVLSLETGFERDYRPGRPYAPYYASDEILYPVPRHREEEALAGKRYVFGLTRGGAATAFPLEAVAEERVWNAEAGGEPVLLLSPGSVLTVTHDHPEYGELTYRAGGAVRAYGRGARRFRAGETEGVLLDELGRPWRVTEAALLGPDGSRVPRIAGTLAYGFAWQAFHPRSELRRAPAE